MSFVFKPIQPVPVLTTYKRNSSPDGRYRHVYLCGSVLGTTTYTHDREGTGIQVVQVADRFVDSYEVAPSLETFETLWQQATPFGEDQEPTEDP